MFTANKWSNRKWFFTIAVAVSVWITFSIIGPGDDYFRCYTWMVMEPWRIAKVAEETWTLNPTWFAPFMAPFVTLPGRAGYIIFMAATTAVTVLAAYIFGGKAIPTLLSAQMMWILWWGQIEGWAILGLILALAALTRKSWLMMFLALSMAAFKPQVGFIPVLALWWWSGKDRWKSLAGLIGLFFLSIWIWGPWPLWYYQGATRLLGSHSFGPLNASIGLAALPLFIPAVLLPLNREKRMIALTATAYVVSPYLPYYSTILLLVFNLPWWAYLFAFLGYLPDLVGTGLAWNAIVFLPISVLTWLYWPILSGWIRGWKTDRKAHLSPPLEF